MVKNEKLKVVLARVVLFFVLFLMYLPILVLIVFSFTKSTELGTWTGFSLQLYKDLFENKSLMRAIGNTLLIALVSALVSTILGTLGAVGTFYTRKRAKKSIETMTQLPVVNAEIVMALSLAVLFKAVNASYTFLTLLVGHVVLTVAFV